MAHARFDLVVVHRGSNLRLPLWPDTVVELFNAQTHEYIGQVSGDVFYKLLAHHLSTAALQAQLAGELEGRLRVPVHEEAVAPAGGGDEKSPGRVDATLRAALRGARRARSPRKPGARMIPSHSESLRKEGLR